VCVYPCGCCAGWMNVLQHCFTVTGEPSNSRHQQQSFFLGIYCRIKLGLYLLCCAMFVLGCKLCEALSVINACVLYDAVFIHTQLFKKPHPQKKLSLRGGLPAAATQLGFFVSSAANDRLFFHNVDNLRPSMQPLKGEHCSM